MLRLVLIFILVGLAARTFWRVVDGIVEGLTGRGASQAPDRVAQLVRDPVCGTWVLPTRAVTLSDAGRAVHFCSTACRDHYRSRSA